MAIVKKPTQTERRDIRKNAALSMPSIVAADRHPVPALQQNCLGSNSGEKEI
jgi:hypothetical protein